VTVTFARARGPIGIVWSRDLTEMLRCSKIVRRWQESGAPFIAHEIKNRSRHTTFRDNGFRDFSTAREFSDCPFA